MDIPSEVRVQMKDAFFGREMRLTQLVWRSLEAYLSEEAYDLMVILWTCQKRWDRGRKYHDGRFVAKALDTYTTRVTSLIEGLDAGTFGLVWTYRKLSQPVNVPWGRGPVPWGGGPVRYYGQVSIQTPYGTVSFLDNNPERVVKNHMNFYAPLVEDMKAQSHVLLKFLQALGGQDVSAGADASPSETSFWDMLEDED